MRRRSCSTSLKAVTVRIRDGRAVDMTRPGDMYLHPAGVPHNPMREAGSLASSSNASARHARERQPDVFCDECNHKLHDTYFELTNIEKDFLPRFREFYGSEDLRTCDSCGHVMDVDPRFVD